MSMMKTNEMQWGVRACVVVMAAVGGVGWGRKEDEGRKERVRCNVER